MFIEGSIFRDIGKERYGDIIKVLDKNEGLNLYHNVYRYAMSFNIPIKLGE